MIRQSNKLKGTTREKNMVGGGFRGMPLFFSFQEKVN